MQRPLLTPLASLLAISSMPAQQDILYYKFDEGGGANVVNYAPASSPAPREGLVVSTDTTAFAPGRFGAAALRGGGTGGVGFRSHIDTGWNGTFSGSFTVAWWMRQRIAPAGTSYIFDLGNAPATQMSFRCFTGGVAARGLYLRYWGGTTDPLILPFDLQTAAANAWVHVAIVVDPAAGFATWYVNGQSNTAIPITGSANVVTGTQNFLVGYYPQFTGLNNYDLDEFRFLNRPVSVPEVFIWAQRVPAADGAFGTGCGLTLASQSGPPALGNTRYALNTTGTPAASGVLMIGTSRVNLNGVPLPFDLGALVGSLNGCLLHTSLNVLLLGATTGVTPLPLPSDASLEGATVYAQALMIGSTWMTSNALGISLGI